MEQKFKYLNNDEWILTDFSILVKGWEMSLADVELDGFYEYGGTCEIILKFRGNQFNLFYHSTQSSLDPIGYIEKFASFSKKYTEQKAEKRQKRIRGFVLRTFLYWILASFAVAGIGISIGDLALYWAMGFIIATGILYIAAFIYVFRADFKTMCAQSVMVEYSSNRYKSSDGTKDIVKGAVVGGIVAGGAGAAVGAIIALNKHLNKKK